MAISDFKAHIFSSETIFCVTYLTGFLLEWLCDYFSPGLNNDYFGFRK